MVAVSLRQLTLAYVARWGLLATAEKQCDSDEQTSLLQTIGSPVFPNVKENIFHPKPIPSGLLECLQTRMNGNPLNTYVSSHTFGLADLPDDFRAQVELHNLRVSNEVQFSGVVLAQSPADVQQALRCAHEYKVPVKAQCGRHAYEPYCTQGCLLVNIKNMSNYSVDVATRTAQLGAGMNLGQVYTYLGDYNFTVPGGTCPWVGLAGLVLGGGKGVLIRLHGLLCDKLFGVDVILYNGTFVHASAQENADLFWMARGGGGAQFPGVAVAFHFNLVEAPHVLQYSKDFLYSGGMGTRDAAKLVIQYYADRLANHPDKRVYARLTLNPYENENADGRVTVLYKFLNMTEAEARSVLMELNTYALGFVDGDTIKFDSMSWVEQVYAEGGITSQWSECANLGMTPREMALKQSPPFCGWDSGFVTNMKYRALVMSSLPSAGIDDLLETSQRAPDFLSGKDYQFYLQIDPSNGAVLDVAVNATAYPWRTQPEMVMQVIAKWDSTTKSTVSDPVLFYNFGLVAQMQQYVGTRSYDNYLDRSMPGGAIPAEAYWGTNADRVRSIRDEYASPVDADLEDPEWELERNRAGMGYKITKSPEVPTPSPTPAPPTPQPPPPTPTPPTPQPTPPPTLSPTQPSSAPEPATADKCCFGGCGGSCQGGWCAQSKVNCEGACSGVFCPGN